MQTKSKTKDRKFNISGIVLIVVLLLVTIGVVVVLQNYWGAYQYDKNILNKKISDLQNSHNATQNQQTYTGPASSQTVASTMRAAVADRNQVQLEQSVTVQLLQQLYVAIDDLPNNPGTGKKISESQIPSANTSTNPKQKTSSKNNGTSKIKFADEMMDDVKGIVKVSKRSGPNIVKRSSPNTQIYKLKMQLIVNDMRWAWLYQDMQAYEQAAYDLQGILQKQFDVNDAKVQQVLNILTELNSNQQQAGDI